MLTGETAPRETRMETLSSLLKTMMTFLLGGPKEWQSYPIYCGSLTWLREVVVATGMDTEMGRRMASGRTGTDSNFRSFDVFYIHFLSFLLLLNLTASCFCNRLAGVNERDKQLDLILSTFMLQFLLQ